MKKKILVVEDDAFFSSIMSEELTKVGYEVKSVFDGTHAIQAIEDEKPDLVLLDLLMPQTDGFQVLTALKNNPSSPTTPVIVLSNFGQSQDIKRAKDLGATDFLIKINYMPKQVLEKVSAVLGPATS